MVINGKKELLAALLSGEGLLAWLREKVVAKVEEKKLGKSREHGKIITHATISYVFV